MFKQFFAAAMIFSLTIGTSHASAAVGIKDIFDNFTYTSQVEGNDSLAQANLSSDLKAAREAGISNQEVVNYALSQVKDAKVKSELATTFALINADQLSSEEAQAQIQKIFAEGSNRGASWNGGAGAVALIGVIALIALAAYLINEDCDDRDVFESESEVCDL